MKHILLTVLAVSAAVGFRQAQTTPPPAAATASASPQNPAPVKEPVTTALRTILPGRQKNILGAIEAMPADKFSYKPTADQITFAHLVAHITESNNSMCAKVADIAAPKVEEQKETDSKDQLLARARASFEFCTLALSNADDSKLGEIVDFGRTQGPRALAVFYLTGGWADHYGAAAMYLRLNGILPPSAQPKK
jgi:hypothetical protein